MRGPRFWGVVLAWALAGCAAWGAGLPLTLAGESAYTLPRGAWLIGYIRFPSVSFDPAQLELRYGLTDRLEIGTKPLLFLFGLLNGEVKYGVGVVGGASLALGASVAIPSDLGHLSLGAGGYLSFPGRWGWHSRVELRLLPSLGLSAGLALDLGLFPWLRLLGELNLPPLGVLGGALVRLGELGLLRAVVGARLAGEGVAPFSYLELFAYFGPR